MERNLSRRDIIKLIGLAGAIPILSACDRVLNPIPPLVTPENTSLPSSTNTPRSTETPTQPPEPTHTPTPTETPTVTPTETRIPAENVWQLSPDGHVYYNEAELYGGLFTINKEHPEWVEKYWEDTVRGLWNLNLVGENTAFLSQFPSADSLVDYVKNGGGPVSNLWKPVKFPDGRRQYWWAGTLVPTDSGVDLSNIAIAIYKPTRDEMYKWSPSYYRTNFYPIYGAGNQFLIEEINVEGKNILRFTFRSDILMDDVIPEGSGLQILRLALTEDKSPEENLKAASQLVRSIPFQMLICKDRADGSVGAWAPPLNSRELGVLNIYAFNPTGEEFAELASPDGSPLSLR